MEGYEEHAYIYDDEYFAQAEAEAQAQADAEAQYMEEMAQAQYEQDRIEEEREWAQQELGSIDYEIAYLQDKIVKLEDRRYDILNNTP